MPSLVLLPVKVQMVSSSLFGLLMGVVGWLIGAKFTIDGAIAVGDWLLMFMGFSGSIPLGMEKYSYFFWIPLVISVVEWTNPFHLKRTAVFWPMVWGLSV